VEVIALAARAHRKQSARLDSPELAALPREKRRMVRGLAGILRIADALDRSHSNVVRRLVAKPGAHELVIEVDSGPDDCTLELWTAERRADLLARLLERKVTLTTRRATRIHRANGIKRALRNGAAGDRRRPRSIEPSLQAH
jgi:exopolyphosphatase/guanosine-5'-triphosphate,3'-diphosphate pyrophosphatase